MTNRVVLGARGSEMGIWVSKPGYNVLTASEADMLLSSNQTTAQIVQTGRINASGNAYPYLVTFPNLEYTPIVMAMGIGPPFYLTFPAINQVAFNVVAGTQQQTSVPQDQWEIRYQIFAVPLYG